MQIMKSNRRFVGLVSLLAVSEAFAQAPSLAPEDKDAIQQLSASYAKALAACHAEELADLFVPNSGSFASGFRGRMVGRDQLILLVQSERHCTGAQSAPPSANPPMVAIEATQFGARGVAKLGMAEYQDEYTKTQMGWRFASRTVITTAEKAAGLDAREMLAIQKLGGANLGNYYEPDPGGVARLLTSGVRINVSGNEVTGRVFLKDGGYDDVAYEKLAPGQWRVKSSTHVASQSR